MVKCTGSIKRWDTIRNVSETLLENIKDLHKFVWFFKGK